LRFFLFLNFSMANMGWAIGIRKVGSSKILGLRLK